MYRASRERPTEEDLDIKIKIPTEQSAKLQIFARRQGKTISQYMQEMLTPILAKGQTSFNTETEGLRYYVSPEEHRVLKKYFKSKRLSARTCVSHLALKALRRRKKK